MRYTEYFLHMRTRPDRAGIREHWIRRALLAPERIALQGDGRMRLWEYIPEAGRYLRVIVLSDGQTVHNAFFDRRFRP